MRNLIPVSIMFALLAGEARAGEPDLARVFGGRDGCFELYDLRAGKQVVRFNPRRCAQRTSPCSTFKVSLALMAFDAGLLKDERSTMKWDGTKTSRAVWNRDQTAATWMRESVVWFSQRLAQQLGMKRLKTYVSRFGFGNQDLSGGLTTAWLESSLRVSPDEELRFWQRFWRGELPVSKRAVEMTKRITLVERSAAGWTLHGKTGTCMIGGGESKLGHGWFVGHTGRGDREYVFVTAYTDRETPADSRPAGWIARDLAKRILAEMSIY